MEHITEIMMQLIGSEVLKKTLSLPVGTPLTDKNLITLLLLSRKHGVAHLTASALLNNGYLENCPQRELFLNEIYTAVYAQEKMSVAYDEICSVLEKNKIPYIPLKGAVIRSLYPNPWMRTSCDIDILVKEETLENAIKAITSVEGYCCEGESKHDVVIKSPEGIVIELHYRLLGNKKSSFNIKALYDVWENAYPAENSEYKYELTDDIFYYYHILHMAKHFRIGGCGMRPFIDLLLMDNKYKSNFKSIDRLLKKGGLAAFADNARKLSRVWFLGEEHSEITLQMQNFIIEGGMFGTKKTRMVSNSQRGKFRYIFSRIFVPTNYLKRDYPVLNKYPFLSPWCFVLRLFSLTFGKKKNFRDGYMEKFEEISYSNEFGYMFENLGLK